tara:strand:+ start:449 stop:1195 length:747 start_codon:yes stop_codon:yes gene_type:complete
MPAITSRALFKAYCQRKLGSPVIQINVSDDQIEDRIDDALEFYQDYHFDAVEDTYVPYMVTSSDITNKYITTDQSIIGIKQVIPFYQKFAFSTNMFDVKYQLFLNDVYNLTSSEMLTYQITQDHLQLVNNVIHGTTPIRYQRHMNRLFVDADWGFDLLPNEYIIIECTRIIDPDVYTDVWNDRWLKRYATALIKKQWGENLSKFEGVALPGGVTFNGANILQEAKEEIQILEEQMSLNYELPVDMMIG